MQDEYFLAIKPWLKQEDFVIESELEIWANPWEQLGQLPEGVSCQCSWRWYDHGSCCFLIKIASNQKIFHFHWLLQLLLAATVPGTKRMPREWHKRRGGGNSRELRGHLGYQASAYLNWGASHCNCKRCASQRCSQSGSHRASASAATSAAAWLSSFHWLPIWSAPAGHWHRSADPHRGCQSYFYWNFSNLRRFLYGHTLCTESVCECISVSVCVWVIVGNMLCDKCRINSPWIGGEIARILPNRMKRLRRQTCLGFCCYHDQKT